MKWLKANPGKLLIAVCEAITGFLLLRNPTGFTLGILKALGILLIIGGILQILRYFRLSPEDGAKSQGLTRGILELLAGLICALNSQWLLKTFPALTMVYGIVILVLGVFKLQAAVDLARLQRRARMAAVSAVVTIVCAAVILCNPFHTTALLWKFLAISLIAEAVLDVICMFFTRKKMDNEGATA